jgi:hypothetical protein
MFFLSRSIWEVFPLGIINRLNVWVSQDDIMGSSKGTGTWEWYHLRNIHDDYDAGVFLYHTEAYPVSRSYLSFLFCFQAVVHF